MNGVPEKTVKYCIASADELRRGARSGLGELDALFISFASRIYSACPMEIPL